jgi:hypothetical protein
MNEQIVEQNVDAPVLPPAEIDMAATYIHWNGLTGHVDGWAHDPDDALKVRVNDTWVFFKDLTRADEAHTDGGPDGETY